MALQSPTSCTMVPQVLSPIINDKEIYRLGKGHNVEQLLGTTFSPTAKTICILKGSLATDATMTHIFNQCRECTQLVLFDCAFLTSDRLKTLSYPTTLKTIDFFLGRFFCPPQRTHFTADSLSYLFTSCPQLEELTLGFCPQITPDVLAQMPFPNTLKVLQLCYTPSLNQTALQHIFSSCPQLQNISFNCAGWSSNNFLFPYPSTLKRVALEGFDIHTRKSTSHKLNDAGLQCILTSCPSLENLGLGNCDRFAFKNMSNMPFPQTLQELYLDQVALNEFDIEHILRSCPLLRNVVIDSKHDTMFTAKLKSFPNCTLQKSSPGIWSSESHPARCLCET